MSNIKIIYTELVARFQDPKKSSQINTRQGHPNNKRPLLALSSLRFIKLGLCFAFPQLGSWELGATRSSNSRQQEDRPVKQPTPATSKQEEEMKYGNSDDKKRKDK